MATNKAKFTINGTPAEDPTTSDRGFVGTAGQTLTVQLESPSGVLSARFEVYDSNNSESPLASFGAPAITWTSNGLASISIAPSSSTAIDLPGSGVHSYIIRCTVTLPGSNNDDQVQVFERIAAILDSNGLRKTVPGESIQFRARAWSDDLNEYVDNIGGGGGGSSPLTTKGDVYTHDGSQDARLPVGTDGQVLTAASAQSTGLIWATPSGGGGSGFNIDDTDVFSSGIFEPLAIVSLSTNNRVVSIEGTVIGIDPTNEEVGIFKFIAVFYRDSSGNVFQRGSTSAIYTQSDNPNWDYDLNISGTDVQIRVKGVNANTIEWRVQGATFDHG